MLYLNNEARRDDLATAAKVQLLQRRPKLPRTQRETDATAARQAKPPQLPQRSDRE